VASSNFNALWDWNDSSRVIPATSFTWSSWPNSDDLRVQRVDLSPLFVRLVLSTYSSTRPALYSIDSTNLANEVTNLVNVDRYFIQDSILSLGYQLGGSAVLDTQQILIQNSSFLYYQDRWHGSVSGAAFVGGMDIAAVVDQYVSAYENTNAMNSLPKNGTNQQAIVVQSMIDFMDAYSTWAAAGFPYSPGNPPAYLGNAQAAMKTAVQGQYLHSSYDPFAVPCQ